MRATFGVTLIAFACSNNHPAGVDAAIDAPKQIDAAHMDAPGATMLNLTGGANGLLWNATTSTLYLTDSNADTFVEYTDAGGLHALGTLPPDPSGVSLGNVLQLANGSLLTADFGFGSNGTIDQLAAGSGSGIALTGLDVTRKRIDDLLEARARARAGELGLGGGATGDHQSRHAADGGRALAGEVRRVEVAATVEREGGIVVSGTTMYVSDQGAGTIYTVDLGSGGVGTLISGLVTTDLLFMLPDGDMLTGGSAAITRITQAGSATTLSLGTFSDVRGIAYDGVGHRLFVVDHSSTAGTPDVLHIIPFTP
jgi:hypothetical protein